MPIYEYRCKECGNQFEMLQRVGEESEGLRCPQCGEVKVQRLLSLFAAAGHGSEPQMNNGGGACCGGGGCGCRH